MYLDAGIGAILIQILIGFAIAVPVLIGIFRGKIRAFFSRSKSSDKKKR